MNRSTRYGVFLKCLLLLLLSLGCERRPLEDDTITHARISIGIDWSKCGLEAGEATVVFYPEDGSNAITAYIYNGKGEVDLVPGTYSVITFNQKYDDFDAIAFRGMDKYQTIEAFIKPINKAGYIPEQGELTVDNPEMLVSDSRDEFIVTQKMLERTRYEVIQGTINSKGGTNAPDIQMELKPLSIHAEVTVHIRNLHLIRKGSQQGIVRGFAEAIRLNTRKASSQPVTQFFELPQVEYYKDSPTNGWIKGEITVFGECVPETTSSRQVVSFELNTRLRDKNETLFKHKVDITKLIKYHIDTGVNITCEIGTDPGQENSPIEIPKVDPDGPDSGFQPDVDDWEEEEEVIKPI